MSECCVVRVYGKPRTFNCYTSKVTLNVREMCMKNHRRKHPAPFFAYQITLGHAPCVMLDAHYVFTDILTLVYGLPSLFFFCRCTGMAKFQSEKVAVLAQFLQYNKEFTYFILTTFYFKLSGTANAHH